VDAEKKAQRRPVTLGQTVRDQVVIEAGLQGGETVIAEGLQRVRPGQEVNAAPVGAPPPGSSPGGPQAAGRPG
jgi:membrane fusion protein, multidrug efflux system